MTAQRLPPPSLLVAGATGLGAAGLAAAVAGLDLKFAVATAAALAGLAGLMLLGTSRAARGVMVAVLTFGLSIRLEKNVVHYIYAPGSYVAWVGGAAALTLSLCLIGALGLAALWFIRAYFYGERRSFRVVPGLLGAQLLFMAAGILSLAHAYDPLLVWLELARLATLLFLTLVAMNFDTSELNLYLRCLAWAVLLQAALAAMQVASGSALGLGVFGEETLVKESVAFEQVTRATGTIGHSNILAYFFEITAPVMLALAYAVPRARDRLLFALALAAAVGGMLLTQSRAAWIGLPLTLGTVTAAVHGRRIFSRNSALVIVAGLVAAGIAAIYLGPMVLERLTCDDAGSAGQRMPLNRAALSVLAQFPLFGVGLNNFAVTFHFYDTTGYSRVFVAADHVVHNMYLLVWTEVGTLGFIAFLWLFLSALLAARRIARSAGRTQAALAVGIGAGLVAHLIHGLFDPGFRLNLVISQLIYVQFGILGAMLLRRRAGLEGHHGAVEQGLARRNVLRHHHVDPDQGVVADGNAP